MGRVRFARFGGGLWTVGLCLTMAVTAADTEAQVLVESTADSDGRLSGSVPEIVRTDGRLEFEIGSAGSGIAVDARLDEAAWATAVRIDLPFEVSPADNASAQVSTECMLTHDAHNIYLGCTASDPRPEGIRAYVVDRDGINGHDRVVLTLDPFNDQRRAFQFGISALGVQSDAVLAQQGAGNPNQGNDGMPIDPSWDAIWASAGAITPDGFVIEAAIPFSSLRFPSNSNGAPWGVFVTRWWPRSSNVELRSATRDRDNSCLLCQANLVSGIRGGAPGVNIQLTPTVTASRADTRADFPTGPISAGPANQDVGLDAQWGLTSDLTLNLTANPDFSQVEADVAQLNVNNRFALFFPEKRPFFLEGADFFGTPIQAVFTRSIADPLAGAKLTGKLGDNAAGVLMARDRTNNLLIPSSQFSNSMSLDEEVTTTIARFRRDVGGTSTVGALFTGREGGSYHNRVGGFDAFYRPISSLTIQAQALRSSTKYPESVAESFNQKTGAFAGNAFLARANWSTSKWLLNADIRQTDADFRADAGFLTMAGVRGGNATLIRRWFGGSDQWFTQLRTQVGFWKNNDFEGNQLNGGIWFGMQYWGPGQTSVGIWPNLMMREYFAGETYEGMNQLYFNVRSAPSGNFSFGVNGNVGDAVDFANARVGDEIRVSPEATLRIGRNVEATLRHTYQRMDNAGQEVFTANLSQVRGVYNFSPRSFFRAILQYNQIDRAPGQYVNTVDETSKSLFAQLLYAYKLNPQTVLFLGYSQDGDGYVDPDRFRVDLKTRGRTFFFKVGYAWRP
jgi:uncharacterized protein DUF5916